MGLDRILHGGLPIRSERDVRRERFRCEAACGNCSMFEPPVFRGGKVGNPFGWCCHKQETREAADTPCLYHERKAIPADEEHGDCGASGMQGEIK